MPRHWRPLSAFCKSSLKASKQAIITERLSGPCCPRHAQPAPHHKDPFSSIDVAFLTAWALQEDLQAGSGLSPIHSEADMEEGTAFDRCL